MCSLYTLSLVPHPPAHAQQCRQDLGLCSSQLHQVDLDITGVEMRLLSDKMTFLLYASLFSHITHVLVQGSACNGVLCQIACGAEAG